MLAPLAMMRMRLQLSAGYLSGRAAGHPEITAEYADRFPNDARKNAEKRLQEVRLTPATTITPSHHRIAWHRFDCML